jgi:hypothetical protein
MRCGDGVEGGVDVVADCGFEAVGAEEEVEGVRLALLGVDEDGVGRGVVDGCDAGVCDECYAVGDGGLPEAGVQVVAADYPPAIMSGEAGAQGVTTYQGNPEARAISFGSERATRMPSGPE